MNEAAAAKLRYQQGNEKGVISSCSNGTEHCISQLSKQQAMKLQQFRGALRDVLQPHNDDDDLLRWLRARNFDLKKSEAMFRKNLLWRQEIGADMILEDYTDPEVIQKYYTGGSIGFDKTGCPIWYDPIGNIDMQGLLRSAKRSAMVKNKVGMMERMNKLFKECSKKNGKKINQLICIMDLKNLGRKHLWKPGIDVFVEMICMFEDHYPETLKQCFIINAASVFPILFNITKPFLSSETKKKIHILGVNYLLTLLEYIDADQLIAHYGGKLYDENNDPKCCSHICYGGAVPKEYFKTSDKDDIENFTEVTIKRGSSVEISADITVPGSLLSWQFTTANCDINFGIFKKKVYSITKQSEMTVVVPSQRVNSHLVPEDGSILCEEPGIYIFQFDNNYSWLRCKHVFYRITIIKPDVDSHISEDIILD